jgi:hypothetical protein
MVWDLGPHVNRPLVIELIGFKVAQLNARSLWPRKWKMETFQDFQESIINESIRAQSLQCPKTSI